MHNSFPYMTIGYHGCDKSICNELICGKSFKKSQNPYDWLGNGIYFWENDEKRALDWAREQKKRGRIKEPAVVGALLDLGNCLNLMEQESISMLRVGYELLKYKSEIYNVQMPDNRNIGENLLSDELSSARTTV